MTGGAFHVIRVYLLAEPHGSMAGLITRFITSQMSQWDFLCQT